MWRRAIEPEAHSAHAPPSRPNAESAHAARAPDIQAGRVIAGKFRLTRQLGQGGMGSVWAAAHQTLGREVAVKFLQPEASSSRVLTNRFVSEAQMVASLKHRFVVDVFDFGVTEDGLHYMVLELLQGRSLADRMDHGPPMSVRAGVKLMADCLRGLDVVHQAGIIHRDLKPDNIFVVEDADGAFPKLIDFGISRRADPPNLKLSPDEARKSRLTQPGVVLGTPFYMSPEQLRGKHSVDARADIYGVGVILYELLAGRLPFRQDNIGDLMVAITVTGATALVELRPDLGPKLSDVVAQAMWPTPEARFASALELRDALLALLPELPEDAMCVVQTDDTTQAGQPGQPGRGQVPAHAGGAHVPTKLDAVSVAMPALTEAEPAPAAVLGEPASDPGWHTGLRAGLAVIVAMSIAMAMWLAMRSVTSGPEQVELRTEIISKTSPSPAAAAPAATAVEVAVPPAPEPLPALVQPEGDEANTAAQDASAYSVELDTAEVRPHKPARPRVRPRDAKPRAPASRRPQRIYRKLDF